MRVQVINTQPKYPSMSVECQALIEGMLKHEAANRMGGNKTGSGGIREHPFFAPQVRTRLFSAFV